MYCHKPTIKEKIIRQRRFWKRATTDRPMIGIRMHTLHPLETFKGGPHSGIITADQLHAEDYFADYERLQQMYSQSLGDEIHGAAPFNGIPWSEAILGCQISVTGYSMWAGSFLHDWSQLGRISFDDHNIWFLKLMEMYDDTNRHFKRKMPVGPPLLRGPGDMASAIRGNDQFCMDLIQAPEKITELMRICSETYLRISQALIDRSTPWNGGYIGQFNHIWAPGPVVRTQSDVSTLISPKHYRELIYPWDVKLLGTFKYIYIHLHASSIHIIDAVSTIRPLAAIQLTLDVGGPKPTDLIDTFRKILSNTPLILQGYMNSEEIVQLSELLPSEGLYILTIVDTLEEGNQLLMDVHKGLERKLFNK